MPGTRIGIEPAAMERGLNAPAYEFLVNDLRQQGFDPELREREEERSSFQLPLPTPTPSEFIVVAVYLLDKVAGGTIDEIVKTLIERMRRSRRRIPKQKRPVGIIYGPDGEELRRVELPDRSDDGDD